MPVDDIRVIMVAVVFGALLGWGLGRRPDDRRPALVATWLAFVVGAGLWVAWSAADSPGDDLATAAVSLGFGGLVSGVVLSATGRRPR